MAEQLHFIEIGGSAMSGLAVAAKSAGYRVSGTDEQAGPPSTDLLDHHQIKWWRQPNANHLKGVDRVIISGGYPADYPEIVVAQERQIPIVSFAQFWGELTERAYSIVVSGTHGKTTTTALVAWLLESAGKAPDYLIGVTPKNFPASVRYTGSDIVVSEGDEYQASRLDSASKFSYYHPNMLVVTSVELDHPDLFDSLAEIEARFQDQIKKLPPDGQLFLCADDAGAAQLAELATGQVSTYGFTAGEWRANAAHFNEQGIGFSVSHGNEELGSIEIGLYGRHNVLNALAAIAVVSSYGIDWPMIVAAAKTFRGANRRFSIITPPSSPIRVIEDFAHHPTAVRATIEAVKLHFGGRVLAIYQPHTFSRTKALLSEYRQAFTEADETFLLPIDGSRERHQPANVTSQDIAAGALGLIAVYDERPALLKAVLAAVRAGDTVLVMSVGGYDKLAQEIAKKLGAK